MTDEDKPRRVTMFRIMPQIKIFDKGTLLKTKQDLYFSTEEDIVETGGEDNFNPIFASITNQPGATSGGVPSHHSFSQSADFLHKQSTVMFVEAAQFRADDNRIYIRAQLLSDDKVVWVNIARVPQSIWGYKLRSEQKTLIKEEIKKMFELVAE